MFFYDAISAYKEIEFASFFGGFFHDAIRAYKDIEFASLFGGFVNDASLDHN